MLFSYLTRRYKPLHMQSMICPTLWYSGRFSPFESLPPRFEEQAEPGEKKTRFVQLPDVFLINIFGSKVYNEEFILIVVHSLYIREKKKVEGSILEKSQATLGCNRSLSKPRKKEVSYCECCHQPFTNLDEVEIFNPCVAFGSF